MSSFIKDNSGASMLLEYVLTIIISAALFTVLLMNLGSIMSKSDRIVMGEELDITVNIVASQLGDYSNELYLNDVTLHMSDFSSIYSVATTPYSDRFFNLPEPYSGRQYSIEVQDNGGSGKVTVTYLSDPGIYSIATFNSPVPVTHKTIICNSYNLKISYDSSTKKMVLEEV
jgi:hypothetical protein